MTLIDLGELTEPTDSPPRRRHRAGNRWLPAGLVALAALLTLAGAAPPPARVHATVPATLGSDVFLAEDEIFTVTPLPGVTDGRQELTAYRRPEQTSVRPQRLTALWRLPVPTGGQVVQVAPVADEAVLVSVVRRRSTADANSTETVLLDTRTGQERWRAPGTATLDASGRALLRTWPVDEPLVLRAVELASGRQLWSKTMAATWVDYHARDGVVDALVVTTSSGDIEILDPASGQVRHSLPVPDDNLAGYQQTSVVDDLLVTVRNSRTVTAYDLDGLTQRWQAVVPLADYVSRCGTLLCARVNRGSGQLLDPETGAVRWSSPEDVNVMLASESRVLALDTTGRDATAIVAIDTATGRPPADYGSWNIVANYEYERHLLGVQQRPDGGLVLARLDPAQARPRIVDVLVGAAGDCQHRYGLIACRRPDGDVGVWRLPASGR
ncbi:PQQ-binding-like beta-propeller repeat protein [Micromonospora sp. FIMYZ51]|uniref:outer membrane protein assembly factor BamB family protein n=1 Tax=Micromonospora sp. FIMYZ51 TaxID=3051832 RepID=UPI00311F68D5